MDGQAQAVPAGWYPDPLTPGQERLWDGFKWLEWTRLHDPNRQEPNPAGWRTDPNNLMFERLWSGDQWTDQRRQTADIGDPGRKTAKAIYLDPNPPRPLAKLGVIAGLLLFATICANIAVIVATQRYIGYETDLINGANPGLNRIRNAIDSAQAANGFLLLALLVTGVFFIAWFYRAYRNLPRQGMTELRFGPGWAIGSWFIPIFAFFRPKAIANDIWKGSESFATPSSSWRNGRVAPLVNWWWGLWVSGSILGTIGGQIIRHANSSVTQLTIRDGMENERFGLYIVQLSSVLLIVSAILAIVFIRRVSAMQDGPKTSAQHQFVSSAPASFGPPSG
jgi:hypothetical protein